MKLKPQIFDIIGRPTAGFMSLHATRDMFGGGKGDAINGIMNGASGLGRQIFDQINLSRRQNAQDVVNKYAAMLAAELPNQDGKPGQNEDTWKMTREGLYDKALAAAEGRCDNEYLKRHVDELNIAYDSKVLKQYRQAEERNALASSQEAMNTAANTVMGTGDIDASIVMVRDAMGMRQAVEYGDYSMFENDANKALAEGSDGYFRGLRMVSDEEYGKLEADYLKKNKKVNVVKMSDLGVIRKSSVEQLKRSVDEGNRAKEQEMNDAINKYVYGTLFDAYDKDGDVRASLGKLEMLRANIAGRTGAEQASPQLMRMIDTQIETKTKIVTGSDRGKAEFDAIAEAVLPDGSPKYKDAQYFPEDMAADLTIKMMELEAEAKAHPEDIEKKTMASTFADKFQYAKKMGQVKFSQDLKEVTDSMFEKNLYGETVLKAYEQIEDIRLRYRKSPMMTEAIDRIVSQQWRNTRVSAGMASKKETAENTEIQSNKVAMLKCALAEGYKSIPVKFADGGVMNVGIADPSQREEAYRLFGLNKNSIKEMDNFVKDSGTTERVIAENISDFFMNDKKNKDKRFTPEFVMLHYSDIVSKVQEMTKYGLGPTKDGKLDERQQGALYTAVARMLQSTVTVKGGLSIPKVIKSAVVDYDNDPYGLHKEKVFSLAEWMGKRADKIEDDKESDVFSFPEYTLLSDRQGRTEARERFVVEPLIGSSLELETGKKIMERGGIVLPDSKE